VVSINSSLLTITLHSSVITTLVYNDTQYSVPFMTLLPGSTVYTSWYHVHWSWVAWPWNHYAPPKRRQLFTRTRRNIPEDFNRHEHCCDNLKCRTARLLSFSLPKSLTARNISCFFQPVLLLPTSVFCNPDLSRFLRCCPERSIRFRGWAA
jgi:hypothetical protein